MNSCDVDKLANSEEARLHSSHDQSPRVNLKLTARNNEIHKKNIKYSLNQRQLTFFDAIASLDMVS